MTSERDIDRAYWTGIVLRAVRERPSLLPHLAVVAMRAAHLGRKFGCSDTEADLLYVAGLIHDVGKVPSLASTGFHPLDGAHLAEAHGAGVVAVLVAQHTGARFEARMHGVAMPYPWEPSVLHDALMLADLTTAPDGTVTTLAERRADIELRYAPDSVEVRSLHELCPDVESAASRLDLK